jgi:hypothetical protein
MSRRKPPGVLAFPFHVPFVPVSRMAAMREAWNTFVRASHRMWAERTMQAAGTVK